MRLFVVIVSQLLFFAGILFSQEKVWVHEEFDNNNRAWPIIPRGVLKATISDGEYRLVSAKDKNTIRPLRTIFIDPAKDFSIEIEFERIGDFNGGSSFGILWGGRDYQNINRFIVYNANAVVEQVQAGKILFSDSFRKTTKDDLLLKKNTMRIAHRQDSNFFFLNERLVIASPFIPFAGMDMGFSLSGELEIAITSLLIRQDNEVKTAANLPDVIHKENIGSSVNSPYNEILPVISPDGQFLYFSCRFHPQNAGGRSDADEIWVSTLNSSGNWDKRKNIDWPLNNVSPNWVISVSPDNNTLLVANLYDSNAVYRGSGLSITQRNNDSWNIPRKVVIKNFVHHNHWYNFSMSADRKTLLMSIMPDDSYGDNDIYVSFIQPDGKWSRPMNIGPVINTVSIEATPFLAADGITLYYSSGGKPGYGGTDIFMSKRLDDSWTNWTEPLNLGPVINSVGDDESFTIPASGNYAYFSSTENSIGGSDLFRFELPLALRPNPVVLIHGKVLNSKTGEPLQVDISYRTLKTNREVGVASSNSIDGGYKIVLPAGQPYSFLGEKEGFYAISENFDVGEIREYREFEKNLYLAPIEVGATIRLNNIFFDFGLAELREESFPELDRVVDFLKSNPRLRIEVSGHTDDIGNAASNKQLSQERAKSVRDYFITSGIEESRVLWEGYGKTKPVVPNDSDENRQQNRRVEFTILNN